jgi:hypothetical protein
MAVGGRATDYRTPLVIGRQLKVHPCPVRPAPRTQSIHPRRVKNTCEYVKRMDHRALVLNADWVIEVS